MGLGINNSAGDLYSNAMLNRGYHAARGISLVLRAPRQVGQLELAAMRHP